ncbi:MAG: hypothetical protein GY847_03395 [Proteobacteria bacterium]|nr:hypothetical protein [Pseudomonadota bacterium]
MQEHPLQQILGTDKRNPNFTIYRCAEDQSLHVYYGAELFEKVPDQREDPQYKLLVARLLSAQINATRLKECFDVDFKTMRRWAHALKRGDPENLVRVLNGRSARRKCTVEIQAFATMRFRQIYPGNRASYSHQIRQEILEVFGESLCAETLRPLFTNERKCAEPNGESSGESTASGEPLPYEDPVPEAPFCETSEELPTREGAEELSRDRKNSPQSEGSNRCVRFVHHLGVLLFSPILLRVASLSEEAGGFLKQWLAAVLLGAVNIEQTKLLDFDALGGLLGQTRRSLQPQRMALRKVAEAGVATALYRVNGSEVNLSDCSDFYYDPHTKQYTGDLKILKGWCGNRHFADKALHMDFIHTAQGHPVYVSYEDNYEDLRGRFKSVIQSLRVELDIPQDKPLRFVFDRGIYSQAVFEDLCVNGTVKIITWAKNYKAGSWGNPDQIQTFIMQRVRNRAEDVQLYRFEYQEERWEKNNKLRLLRVRATNPKNRTIELGVLTHELERRAEEILRLIFRRWVQENDFKYLEKHYGINQITSYASISYTQLQNELNDRQVQSGEHKARIKERSVVRAELKGKLLSEHRHPGKSSKRTQRIEALTKKEKELSDQIEQSEQTESRLEKLITEKYRRLDNSSKEVMDALKLIARNGFYKLLEPFKQAYNNYRDDHVIFRNLTRAHGLLIEEGNEVHAVVYPTAHYAPALKKTVEGLLEQINASEPLMADGSGRKLSFTLGDRMGIELANRSPRNQPI